MTNIELSLKQYQRLCETTIDYFGTLIPGDPRDIYGDVDGLQPYPPGGIPPYYRNNQGRGEVLPVYTTWLQLKYIRDRSRRLCMENEFAICATENRRNYIVGDGFTYRATGDKELSDKVQLVLDAWLIGADVSDYEADAMERLDKDGEFALRFFERASGLVEARFIEPEHIKDPTGDPYSPARAFGVETEIDDVENVLAYHVVKHPWISDATEPIPASEVMHVKLNVPRNAKRGLPTFYPVETNLRRSEDLLASMSSMAKARAKIALIRHMLDTTKTAAQSLVDSLSVGIQLQDPMTGQSTNLERMKYGTILTSSGNVKYEMPSAQTDAGSFVAILQAELRAVAARLQMPEWMLTVDASNANLASSLVAEAPSVKSFRRIQRMLCRRFGESRHPAKKSWAWRQIEYAVRCGVLPREVLYKVQIQCEGPSLVVRNKAEEAEVNRVYYEMGIKSPQTIAQEQSLDYDQERKNRQEAGLDGSGNAPVAVSNAQESLKEVFDDEGGTHGVRGTYVQEPFNTPAAGTLTPNEKQSFAKTRRQGLKPDVMAALKLYRDDPTPANKLAFDKAAEQYKTAAGEEYALTPGEVQPSADELNDWLTTGPVGAISAGRNPNNEEDANLSDEEIAEREESLKNDLDTLGFQYVPIKGKYGSEGNSFLVKVPREKKSALLALGKKYNQDSVLHSQDGENALIYTTGPHQGKENRGAGFEYKPEADDYYSEYVDPNGKPIKFSMNLDFDKLHELKEEVAPTHYTKSEPFKKWFGDWEGDPENASKVVNENGPLTTHSTDEHIKTVYHGTPYTFDEFKPDPWPTAVGKGYYFSENPRTAKYYADKHYVHGADAGKAIKGYNPHVISAHLNIRNPFDFDAPLTDEVKNSIIAAMHKVEPGKHRESYFNQTLGHFTNAMGNNLMSLWEVLADNVGKHKANDILQAAGYDGIVHTSKDIQGSPHPKEKLTDPHDDIHGRMWVAFKPNQIKAVDNKGSFDPNVASIYEEVIETSDPVMKQLLHEYLPPNESITKIPDPEDVVAHLQRLSDYVKTKTNGQHDLPSLLSKGYDTNLNRRIRSNAAESLTAALVGGEHLGGGRKGKNAGANPDTFKVNKHGVGVELDTKLLDIKNPRHRSRTLEQSLSANQVALSNRIPVRIGFTPGGEGKPAKMVAVYGTGNFSADPGSKQEDSRDYVTLTQGDLNDILSNPATVKSVQKKLKNFVNQFDQNDLTKFKSDARFAHIHALLNEIKSQAAGGDVEAKAFLDSHGLKTV